MTRLRFAQASRPTRGQALVEFAIVLPLLVILLVMAIDFGRAFFGWVGLHNVARIGADYAAQFPTADWSQLSSATPTDPQVVEFKNRIALDSAAINCDLEDPLPSPTFPEGTDVGDDAVVHLGCEFQLITPLMEGLMGGPINLQAEAVFPIRRGFAAIPGGGGGNPEPPPCALVPDMVGGTVDEARAAWDDRGFTGAFTPASGFDDDTVTGQTTSPSSEPESDCIPLTATVTVASETAEGCPSGEFRIPLLTGQTIGQARDDWEDSPFSDGDFSPSGQNNAWAAIQDPAAGGCEAPGLAMTVTPGPAPTPKQCVAPDFVGKSTAEAPGLWSDAEFTGSIDYQGRPPYIVDRQSLVAGQVYNCTSNVRLWP